MMITRENLKEAIPLLKTQKLSRDFRSGGFCGSISRALDNVSMEVHPGEILGIAGESGSGKTTLARCSLWLLRPTSGSVCFDGQDLAELSPAVLRAKRQQFQMIFQDPYASLNPNMTVGEILWEPFRVHKIDQGENPEFRLRELLDAVSLNEVLLRRKPAELSGGQLQRVGIARGLSLNPRLLIADEPVSALDVSVQAQILNLLADLKSRYNLTLILISHSLYAINYLCDRVSVMFRGRIIEEAPSSVFFKEPKHPYSRVLLESMPIMGPIKKNRYFQLRGSTAPDPNGNSFCAYHTDCPHVFSTCREKVPGLYEIRPGEKVACFLYH
jgi:oligopeptide/dipeptide ABC transporter ATP-binding protein